MLKLKSLMILSCTQLLLTVNVVKLSKSFQGDRSVLVQTRCMCCKQNIAITIISTTIASCWC